MKEIVDEGVAGTRALLQRFDEINEKFAEDLSPEEMDKVLAEQARVQDKIDAAGAWELDSKLDLAMEALRLPPPDVEVKTLSGGERRRVALCRLLLQSPDLCSSTSDTISRGIGGVAGAVPEGYKGESSR